MAIVVESGTVAVFDNAGWTFAFQRRTNGIVM